MNTVAQRTASRQLNFVVALLDAEISPYMLGALDAERGEMACPEMYFVKRGDMCEYCEGYEAVAGATLTTTQFLGARSGSLTDAEVAAIFAPVPVDDSQLALDLFDYDAAAYALGRQDSAVGRYAPPANIDEHDAYVRGWNDAWAATQPAVKLSR